MGDLKSDSTRSQTIEGSMAYDTGKHTNFLKDLNFQKFENHIKIFFFRFSIWLGICHP